MSKIWQIECVKDGVKAVIPFQRRMRRIKYSICGYVREPLKDTNTIGDGLFLIERLGDVAGKRVLEIGTGWQPMIPILFSIKGAEVYMTDLYPLMRPETFRAALDAIAENRDEIARRLHIPLQIIDCIVRNRSEIRMEVRLNELRLHYLAPGDCRRLPLESGTIDIVISRAVLEHVRPAIIEGIFREARRILRPEGVMAHVIDPSDHWSHRDSRINAVNFLRYPDWLFRLTCINPQNYQNRLRHSEYRAIFEATGFAITSEERTIDKKCVDALPQIQLAAKFTRFTSDDLATVNSIFFADVRS